MFISIFVKMNDPSKVKKSLEFLQNNFREYYRNNKIQLPDRFSRKEFAFVFFGGRGMLRHLSFNKKQQFNDFLSEKAPCHTYYSTAYYKTPDASTMNDKEWMGAELIFDLDADHLPNVENISYKTQLNMVKKEFYKLVNDFLINDFGFKEKHLELYFSGSRGYHCHVKDPNVYHLNSSERREIVDYIIGRDLIENIVFQEHSTGTKQFGGRTYSSGKALKMPSPDDPGWRGRISRGIIDIIEDITNSDDPYEKLMEYGVGKSDAEKLLLDLSSDRINRIKKGQIDQSKTIRKFFLNNVLRKSAVSFASGETDEPVTCDVKRLIRLPDSLHGKTGLKVTEVNLDSLKDFDPLKDTIVFSDVSIQVDMLKNEKIFLNNTEFNLKKGLNDVPLYLAVFLIGKKSAYIV
jgi:DNA primase small subunit